MRRTYIFFCISIFFPCLIVLFHVYAMVSVDRKLQYKTVQIKREQSRVAELTGQRETPKGIKMRNHRRRVYIWFTTPDNIHFERIYSTGLFGRVKARTDYNHIQGKSLTETGIYVNPSELNKNKVPFFFLNKGPEKTAGYYYDIFSFIKWKYGIFIMIVCFCYLYFITKYAYKTFLPARGPLKVILPNVLLFLIYFFL